MPRTCQTSHAPSKGDGDTSGLQRRRVSLRGNGSLSRAHSCRRELDSNPGLPAPSPHPFKGACMTGDRHCPTAEGRRRGSGLLGCRPPPPRWPWEREQAALHGEKAGLQEAPSGVQRPGFPLRLRASLSVVSRNSLPSCASDMKQRPNFKQRNLYCNYSYTTV